MKRWFASLLVAPCLVAAIACVHQPRSLPPEWQILAGEPAGLTSLSDPITLIADNQLHNIYSEPVPIYRTARTDQLVPSSIRSALLDFYGQDVLRWVLERGAQANPVVHLGDACDFACTGEFSEFVEIMASAPEGWVMVPGNHDCFFYGNEQRDPADTTWIKACTNAGFPMTKDRFIRYYLAALIGQDRPESGQLLSYLRRRGSAIQESDIEKLTHLDPDELRCLIPEDGDWISESPSFLRAVAWKIDQRHPWRSFIVQRIELTSQDQLGSPMSNLRVGGILLDTCQYRFAPGLVPIPLGRVPAGLKGEILEDQLRVVRMWLEAERQQFDYTWVLMGHHPYDALRPHVQRELVNLMKSARIPLFVSAHTHAGDFLVHGRGEDAWLELNIGSILDWPMEYRTLYLGLTDDDRVYIRSQLISAQERLTRVIDDQDRANWQVTQQDDDYYLRHAHLDSMSAERTEIELKNALLATHRRMIRAVGTDRCARPSPEDWPRDPWSGRRSESDSAVVDLIDAALAEESLEQKISVLVDLKRFEQARLEKAASDECPEYEHFRLTQAIWSSKFDAARARKPWRDDWIVALPKE